MDFITSKKEGGAAMKKLVFPFIELEVPDDCPDGLDFEAEIFANAQSLLKRCPANIGRLITKIPPTLGGMGRIAKTPTFLKRRCITRNNCCRVIQPLR